MRTTQEHTQSQVELETQNIVRALKAMGLQLAVVPFRMFASCVERSLVDSLAKRAALPVRQVCAAVREWSLVEVKPELWSVTVRLDW
jgi:hypothetical protein